MASRFFAVAAIADSDSDSDLLSSSDEELVDSSSEEILESSEDEAQDDSDNDSDDSDEPAARSQFLKSDAPLRSVDYFKKGSNIPDLDEESESDLDDENKKVVKSAREKLLEEMEKSAEEIESALDFDDWVLVLREFDKLNKLLVRAQQQGVATPRCYVRTLAELDKTIVLVSKDNAKMNGVTAKAFNTIKQRVKKTLREFETLLAEYNKDPEAFMAKKDTPAASIAPKAVSNDVDVPAALRSVVENRGKKNVDRHQQVRLLEELLDSAVAPFQRILVYMLLIPLRFDLLLNASQMPVASWNRVEADILALLTLLEDNASKYRVHENAEPGFDFATEPAPGPDGVVSILGLVTSFVERLDDELTKSLLALDQYGPEYQARLKGENVVYTLLLRCQLYLESFIKIGDELAHQLYRVLLRRVEHIYYKPARLVTFHEEKAWLEVTGKSSITPQGLESLELMDALCDALYKLQSSAYTKKTTLCHVYHCALFNQYHRARDMLLMLHIQLVAYTLDTLLQVLFNRALVQLGLCAFRHGLMEETYQTLEELHTLLYERELLGQGVQRYAAIAAGHALTLAADKQRLLPYHMHVNLELVEAVFFTASMLLKVPEAAQKGPGLVNRKAAMKSFKRMLEYHDRQVFQGPPENTRDHIMYAAKSLEAGDWKRALQLLSAVSVWDLLGDGAQVRQMITGLLQVEGLRTYVFQYRTCYTQLLISTLAELFELPENKVKSVLAKMIYKGEVHAALDQPAHTVSFNHARELNKTQEFAVALAEKVSVMAERNERLASGGSFQSSERYSQGHHGGGNARRHHHGFKISSSSGIIAGALSGMGGGRR